jgi:hypothetical protein
MPESRTAVMTLVEASWQDQSGTLQTVPARMENKSTGGACIRVKTPIGVGSKLMVQWRWEQFSGIAKYCRSEGKEYRVGIQRDATYTPLPEPPAPTHVIQTERPEIIDTPVFTAKIQSRSNMQAQPQESEQEKKLELQTNLPVKRKESGKERKRMQRNWLGLPHWNNKDGFTESAATNGAEDKNANRALDAASPTQKVPADFAGEKVAGAQVELLPIEEIYLAAGIVNPRKGYSIIKVVEMLNSEHVRALPREMKCAAVLMALDAAGIPIDQIEQDAKARQDALNSYEAAQQKQIESEWARKAEENIQIQAEMERVKTRYMARISRNLEEVAREKTRFITWLSTQQQEIQSMMEAVELCLKPVASQLTTSAAEVSHVDVPKNVKTEVPKREAAKSDATKLDEGKEGASPKSTYEADMTVLPEVSLAKAAVAGKPM